MSTDLNLKEVSFESISIHEPLLMPQVAGHPIVMVKGSTSSAQSVISRIRTDNIPPHQKVARVGV